MKKNKKTIPSIKVSLWALALVLTASLFFIRQNAHAQVSKEPSVSSQGSAQTVSVRIRTHVPINEDKPAAQKDSWDAVDEMERIRKEMNRMFEEAYERAMKMKESLETPAPAGSGTQALTPVLQLKEDQDGYQVYSKLSGMKKDDIKISFTGSTLTVEGEKKFESRKDDEVKGTFFEEERLGSFSQKLTLPSPVEASRITADFENETLTIRLPKVKQGPIAAEQVQTQ